MTESIRICERCVSDTTFPDIRFNEDGICNYCELHDRMDQRFALDGTAQSAFQALLKKIKKAGKNKKYDCVIGISGGRDSIYTLHQAKTVWGLRPLAVHFNDGFGNPVAGKNMLNAVKKLDIDLRTISSDWRESKDLRLSFLKASTPELDEGTHIGVAAALYGSAAKEGIKYILIGQSFRTEGMTPLAWNYLDGKYLSAVHNRFGSVPLRKWKPHDPGFNLNPVHLFYYTVFCGIKTVFPLYYQNYVRTEAEKIITKDLNWEDTGAHYFDDLFQAFIHYLFRIKFNIDRRKYNYSALVRSGQLTRERALDRIKTKYKIEDPKVIDLCIKRLGITRKEFDKYSKQAPKTFMDYPNSYKILSKFKPLVKFMCKAHILPAASYDKFFSCGEPSEKIDIAIPQNRAA